MIKKIAVGLAVAFATFSVFAQSHEAREINNYIPGLADRIPDGATGQGVVYTSRAVGRVISVGAPITKNYVIGNTCTHNGTVPQQQQQQQSTLNPGSLAGAVIGGVVGSRFGGGVGKDILTIGGAVVGSAVGSEVYNNSNRNQQVCQNVFETRVVGYSFIAQYQYIQVQGFMRRQPQIGDDVEIIIRSVIYAGS